MKRRFPKPWKLVLACLLLGVLLASFELLRFGGVFTSVENRFDGDCRAVPIEGGSEDIEIDLDRGIAYLSVLDRDKAREDDDVNGTVLLLDLNPAEPAPRAAMSVEPAGLRPHGMSLLLRPGQPARLFVISHRADGSHAVEMAEQNADGTFVPRATYEHAAFTNPNALVAVGPEQFYLVNSTPEQGRFEEVGGMLLRSGNASLVYFDGKTARPLVEDLAFPAGIAMSPDGTRLYVGEALAKAMRVYSRAADGSISPLHTVDLGTAPDNLRVDPAGVVWIAAHPKLLRHFWHSLGKSERAPTQLLRYDPRLKNAGDGEALEEFFVDDGSRLSAGTVAVPWHGGFLVGALRDKKVLMCKPNP